MSKQNYRNTARWFHILSHPVRLRILHELLQEEKCVCELQEALRRPQPYISQQLRVLRESEIVACHKRGLFVYYTLADPRVKQVLNMLWD